MPYANNKGADQPACIHSLISAFIICCLNSTYDGILIVSKTSENKLSFLIKFAISNVSFTSLNLMYQGLAVSSELPAKVNISRQVSKTDNKLTS